MAPKPTHKHPHTSGHGSAHPTHKQAAVHSAAPVAAPIPAPAPAPPAAPRRLQLPSLVARVDEVGHLLHELEALNNTLLQLGIRSGGTKIQLPKTSLLMDRLIEANDLNLLRDADRLELTYYLKTLHTKAPVMHFSFGADPSPAFVDKLIVWLRREIHPNVLLSIGLQPNVGAGCILRTTNKYFDLSLRQDFIDKRPLLRESLKVMAPSPPQPVPQPEAAA